MCLYTTGTCPLFSPSLYLDIGIIFYTGKTKQASKKEINEIENRKLIEEKMDSKAAFLKRSTKLMCLGFPGGSDGKESACNAGYLGSILVSGRSPGEGKGNTLQYTCLEKPKDEGAWWATVHRVAKSQTQLSGFYFTSQSG